MSRFYGLEMAVVDTLNAIINRFGEDKNYGQRVFLLFDGVHYDPLYLEESDVSYTCFSFTERVPVFARNSARISVSSRG